MTKYNIALDFVASHFYGVNKLYMLSCSISVHFMCCQLQGLCLSWSGCIM